MRSGPFNVIYVTFGGFTLLSHFMSYLKYLLPRNSRGRALSTAHSPKALH